MFFSHIKKCYFSAIHTGKFITNINKSKIRIPYSLMPLIKPLTAAFTRPPTYSNDIHSKPLALLEIFNFGSDGKIS